MNDVKNLGSTEMFAVRQASKVSIAFGAVLSVLGIFAVLAPLFTGVAVTVLVGMLLLVAGSVEIVFAFKAGSFGKGVLRFISAAWVSWQVWSSWRHPEEKSGCPDVCSRRLFRGRKCDRYYSRAEAEAGRGLGLAAVQRDRIDRPGWSHHRAVARFRTWAVGLYIGIRMLMHGWILMALGRTGQEMLTYLQDARIEMLERHVRTDARALQETQAQLADHTAMLLAMDNELRKKVSSSEIDPAIQNLNRRLGEAREQMQAATSATRESWNKTQNEANAAFETLRKSGAEITKRLKHELGLEE